MSKKINVIQKKTSKNEHHHPQENLWKEKTEKQIAVGNNVVQILPCLSNQNKQVFFELLKLMLSLKKSEDVKEVWENVLVDGIANFPLDVLKTEIIKISYEKTGISQIDKSRVLGCKLFGRLAQRVEPFVIFLIIFGESTSISNIFHTVSTLFLIFLITHCCCVRICLSK